VIYKANAVKFQHAKTFVCFNKAGGIVWFFTGGTNLSIQGFGSRWPLRMNSRKNQGHKIVKEGQSSNFEVSIFLAGDSDHLQDLLRVHPVYESEKYEFNGIETNRGLGWTLSKEFGKKRGRE